MLEIERKFLVRSEKYKDEAMRSYRIVQAYLNSHPERTVRVRIKGDKGILTVKGKSNASGTTRMEWEKEISIAEAESLLPLCEPGAIEKIRYEVTVGKHIYEVDDFLGVNKGLVIAEIELQSEAEDFTKPTWLGEEVTGQEKYYNSQLASKPFAEW